MIKYFRDFKLNLKYFQLLAYVINIEVSYKIKIKINIWYILLVNLHIQKIVFLHIIHTLKSEYYT